WTKRCSSVRSKSIASLLALLRELRSLLCISASRKPVVLGGSRGGAAPPLARFAGNSPLREAAPAASLALLRPRNPAAVLVVRPLRLKRLGRGRPRASRRDGSSLARD